MFLGEREGCVSVVDVEVAGCGLDDLYHGIQCTGDEGENVRECRSRRSTITGHQVMHVKAWRREDMSVIDTFPEDS